jgi:alpha-D-xyloside xylohydrolase
LSGYPYWTTDIGGYWPPHDNPIADPAFQELYARWFEFGTFCPIFRTHGHRPHNELWSYDKVEPTLIRYDKLRYRLMPYIYSLAWKVTSEDYTIQRPLVMDWRTDEKTWNVGDEFMFGPAILVNPVLKADATHRASICPLAEVVRLLDRSSTLRRKEIDADAPLDRMPLYVRAGSILPMGPEIEYAAQNPGGPVRTSHLSRSRWPIQSLRRCRRQLRLREGPAFRDSHSLERQCRPADHRRARRILSGYGRKACVPHCSGCRSDTALAAM